MTSLAVSRRWVALLGWAVFSLTVMRSCSNAAQHQGQFLQRLKLGQAHLAVVVGIEFKTGCDLSRWGFRHKFQQ